MPLQETTAQLLQREAAGGESPNDGYAGPTRGAEDADYGTTAGSGGGSGGGDTQGGEGPTASLAEEAATLMLLVQQQQQQQRHQHAAPPAGTLLAGGGAGGTIAHVDYDAFAAEARRLLAQLTT